MQFGVESALFIKLQKWNLSMRKKIKSALGTVRDMRPWITGHTHFLFSQFSYSNRNLDSGYTDDDHLLAAAKWLETAQDATPDGGITGRYKLNVGWTSSYPETTGYIIPTLLNLEKKTGDKRFYVRAKRCVDFLLELQLDSGAFPGAEVHENTGTPSPFNTAQIISGLVAWHKATNCEKALNSARRAGNWLLTVQDDDGAFRRHFYCDQPATYSAHLSCWLAELGDYLNESSYLNAARRHMDWVMTHYESETGWFNFCGFDAKQHSSRIGFTHTIAYTLWGVLYCGRILGRQDLIQAVQKSAAGIARRMELSRSLPGLLDSNWKRAGDLTCLTGNAQMALIWMQLHEMTQDNWWLNPAFKAIDEVKRAQCMKNKNSGIQGGISGSYPVWGSYIYAGIPNWAAKFFIDALLVKSSILEQLGNRVYSAKKNHTDLSELIIPSTKSSPSRELSIVVLTQSHSTRLSHFANLWKTKNIYPAAVVFEEVPEKPAIERIWNIINERGFQGLMKRLVGKSVPKHQQISAPGNNDVTAAQYCLSNNLKTYRTGRLTDIKAQKIINDLKPDILIQAGVGILPKEILDIPTLGTLNVHMSILPFHRGMNVAEWAAFNQQPNGCTVHLIDQGIDTGEILATKEVSREGCASVGDLRSKIDEAQRELLADVIVYINETGDLPAGHKQITEDGRQFYRLHADLLKQLDKELNS